MTPMEEFSTFMWMDMSEPPDWNDVEACLKYLMALFHCMVRHGTVHFWGVFHWVLYLVPDTFLVPLRSRFHRAVPLPKRDV